jgi:hypothetical protein
MKQKSFRLYSTANQELMNFCQNLNMKLINHERLMFLILNNISNHSLLVISRADKFLDQK